jgi:hypothetical protein
MFSMSIHSQLELFKLWRYSRYVECSSGHVKAGTWIFFLIPVEIELFLIKYLFDSSEIPLQKWASFGTQSGLLANGFKLLKTGGSLVHNTCRVRNFSSHANLILNCFHPYGFCRAWNSSTIYCSHDHITSVMSSNTLTFVTQGECGSAFHFTVSFSSYKLSWCLVSLASIFKHIDFRDIRRMWFSNSFHSILQQLQTFLMSGFIFGMWALKHRFSQPIIGRPEVAASRKPYDSTLQLRKLAGFLSAISLTCHG